MKDDILKLLPIGSIVLLKEGRKKVMVFGVKQTDKGTGLEHDYIGVVYPEGNLGEEYQFFFDHENIEQVFFRGYEDIERETFIRRLAQYYEESQDSNENSES